MDFPVILQQGFSGCERSLGPLRLHPVGVEAGSGLYGAYHVLEMGQHYDHYVVTKYLPSLAVIRGIATAHPLPAIVQKTRASAVTGNIGEVIAAITLRHKFNIGGNDLRHINTDTKYKTPDFLARFDRATFEQMLPSVPVQYPIDWPVESKAAKTAGVATRSRNDALLQLSAFWYYREEYDASVVGFGVIVTLTYESPREIRVTVVTPSDQACLLTAIRQYRSQRQYTEYLESMKSPQSPLRRMLHNV